LESKYINESGTTKIKQIFITLQASNIPNLGPIWGTLKEVQQAKVNRLLSS